MAENSFGFDPAESSHHFAVLIAESGAVLIEERYTYGDALQPVRPEPRAIVDPYRWSRFGEIAQSHFNRRLKDAKKKTGKFSPGENLLPPHLGKELTLLAWATEGIDPTDMPNAVSNWLGLVPEERWWLYNAVKASGASPEEPEISRGWRRAIRIAFSENPAPPPADARSESADAPRLPQFEEALPTKKKRATAPSPSLFEEGG